MASFGRSWGYALRSEPHRRRVILAGRAARTSRLVKLTSAGLVVSALFCNAAQATDLYWDANGDDSPGGLDDWDTTSLRWHLNSPDGPLRAWPNVGLNNDAILTGTLSTLAVVTPIAVNDIVVNPATPGLNSIVGSDTSHKLTLNGLTKSAITVASGSTLSLRATLAGVQGFTKSGSGTLILDSTAGFNGLVGDITVNGGNVQAGTASNNIAGQALRANAVHLSSGSLTTVGTADLRIGSLSGSGSITPASGRAINILSLADATHTGTITTTGGLNLRGGNGTTQTFGGNVTGLTGTVGVDSGATLALTGTGATSGVLGSVDLAIRGGRLTLDNFGGNTTAVTGRLSNSSAFSLLGGTLSLIGNSAGTTETVGGTTFNGGANTISVSHNGGADGTTLAFTDSGSLRDSTRFTVNFVGAGGTLGTAGSNPRIIFSGALFTNTTNGMLANSSGAAVQTTGWAVVNGTGWAGYGGANAGVVGLSDVSRNSSTLSSAAEQELVGFVPSSTTTTLSANLGTSATVGIGALKITPSASGQSLAVGTHSIFTPAMMLVGSDDFSITGTSGGMQIGTGTRYVWVTTEGTALNYGAAFASTGPLNKSGPGILNLNGSSSQLPAANINLLEGVLRGTSTTLGGNASTGGASTTVNLRGGVLEISGGGTLTRALLTAGTAGGGAINWDNGTSNRGDGGFSAIGGEATVTLVTTAGGSAAATPRWGDGLFVPDGYVLLFGSSKADSRITLSNNVGLDNGTPTSYFAREIRVADNPNSPSDVAVLSGAITGSANADLLKTGPGELELTGTNSYIGNTLIREGTLTVSNGSAIAGAGAVVLSDIAGATLRLNSSETIGTLTGGGTTGGNVNLQANTLTVGDQRDSTFGGVISGAGSVVKQGSGVLNLTAANTFAGGITVSDGVLLANNTAGSATGTGAVVVESGGTLGGTGIIANTVGPVTINSGGALAPGNSVGTLTTNDQTWAAGGIYIWELQDASGGPTAQAGMNWDLADVNGTLTIASAGAKFIIRITTLNAGAPGAAANFDPTLAYSWTIATANAVSGGPIDTSRFELNTVDVANTFDGQFGIAQSGAEVRVTYTPVPEPASIAILAVIGGLGLLRRRRCVRTAGQSHVIST